MLPIPQLFLFYAVLVKTEEEKLSGNFFLSCHKVPEKLYMDLVSFDNFKVIPVIPVIPVIHGVAGTYITHLLSLQLISAMSIFQSGPFSQSKLDPG